MTSAKQRRTLFAPMPLVEWGATNSNNVKGGTFLVEAGGAMRQDQILFA
jgi:hypothetical protein